jgi:hypothetical protein
MNGRRPPGKSVGGADLSGERREPDRKGRPAPQQRGNFPVKIGAGDGNRTHVCSLGSCRSTIELHPRPLSFVTQASVFVSRCFPSGASLGLGPLAAQNDLLVRFVQLR